MSINDDNVSIPSLSLHDALALGEFEVGLMADKHDESEMEQMERLPVLLRLLSSSRPLSSVPTFSTSSQEDAHKDTSTANADDTGGESTPALVDEVANEVVARLENVAATYSVAEGVDVVACHLAPTLCRNLAKLSPLKRKRANISSGSTASNNSNNAEGNLYLNSSSHGWDTGELAAVGANPRSSLKRRRVSQSPGATTTPTTPTTPTQQAAAAVKHVDEMSTGALSEGGIISSDDEAGDPNSKLNKEARRLSRRNSAEARGSGDVGGGTEDLLEEQAAKTLSDLASLVVASLEPVKAESDMDGESHKGKLSLSVEDSALSEPVRRQTAGNVGVMVGSDLGSTVVSLCHYAPVLRQQHVANALCRATIPQTAVLVKRMGANCPTGVPSLLRGCMDAYKSARVLGSRYSSIANMAKSAVRSLASLSDREKSGIIHKLQQEGVMVDVQLRLAMTLQPLSAVCLLIEHLSSINTNMQETSREKGKGDPSSYKASLSYTTSGYRLGERLFLQDSPALLADILSFLQKQLSSCIKTPDDITPEAGRLCLVLRCYAWLVLQYDIAAILTTSDSGIQPLSSFLTVVAETITALERAMAGDGSFLEWMDMPLRLVLCSSILTLGRLLSLEEADNTVVEAENCLKACIECRHKNSKLGVQVARFAHAVQYKDTEAVFDLVGGVLKSKLCSVRPSIEITEAFREGISKVCERAQAFDSVDAIMKQDFSSWPLEDMSTVLGCVMKYTHQCSVEDTTENVKGCLTRILCESSTSFAQHESENMPELIVNATAYLGKNAAVNLPIVSPLQLEINAGKVHLTLGGDSVDQSFLFQVLYWFAYVDSADTSLVRFDLRVLPLKEVLAYCQWLGERHKWASLLRGQLESLLSKHCPEIDMQRRQWELVRDMKFGGTQSFSRKDILRSLQRSLKTALRGDNQAWAIAERSFLIARAHLKDSDIFPCVASQMLATPGSPPPFLPYSMLCHDPLVFLKTSMRVWQCVGLRRIALSIMSALLDTNEAIQYSESPSAIATEEVISSRNLIAVRCALVAVSGSDDSNPEHTAQMCSMTTHFIRRMVAKYPGLVGMLVKQTPGLPDCAIDWLVEFVPEVMNDSKSFVSVLSERGSLTARLNASAAILRFSVAHGHMQEDVTEQLVYAALAQLVSSFFLVIGPVGVPVNVLIGEDSGVDITQTSRRATFRMLRSLVNVRGRMRPALRTECGLALNKLAGLCKSENLLTGVAGSVMSRRKTLLRDMYDVVVKSANAMGSGMDV